MKLRSKTLLAIGTTLLVLIGGLFLFSQLIVSQGFKDLETRDAFLNTERTLDAISSLQESLENKMIDWASWDDPYKWMKDHNKNFEESNFTESSVIAMKIGMWAWIDESRNITFGKQYNAESSSPLSEEIVQFIKTNDMIFDLGSEGQWKNLNAFYEFGGTPMYITVQPILTSEKKGPRHGVLMTGRWLDSETISKLSKTTHLDISLTMHPTESQDPEVQKVMKELLSKKDSRPIFIQPVSDKMIAGYSVIKDLNNKDSILVKMQTSRDIKALGNETIRSLLGGIVGIGLLLLFIMGWLIEKVVLKRLSLLSSTVNDIHHKKDLSLRIPDPQQKTDKVDELGFLTQSMNRMLEGQEESKKSIRRLLDNAGQGFLSFDQNGVISNEFSMATEKMLLGSPAGKLVWDLFDETLRANIKDVLDTLFQELLSFEDLAKMLPKSLNLNGQYLEIKYRPVRDHHGKLTYVMMIISDVTEIRNLEARQDKERRLNGCLIKILANPQDFAHVLDEMYSMDHKILHKIDFIRSLHTLKGGFALFQADELTHLCHHHESALKDTDAMDARMLALKEIRFKVDEFLESHNNILKINRGEEKTVILPQQSIKTFMSKAIRMGVPREMLHELDDILAKPISEVLGWLDRVYASSAEKLGKSVNPIQWKADIKMNPLGYEGLLRSLVHIARNSADHGLETPDIREANGKDPMGHLTVSFYEEGDFYFFKFIDDGQGIDVEKIREKLIRLGRPVPKDDAGVIDTIFESGFSVKNDVTDLSGRGVGLDAVRFEAQKLGGDIKVTSHLGEGATFTIWFKKLSPSERCILAA